MAQSSNEKVAIIHQKRDAKVQDHLSQYAPVWIANEELLLNEDSTRFDLVFYHPTYGWVKRRYKFDSYNNVLYHHGQIAVDEDTALAIQAKEPYISAEFQNVVNSYGG